MKFFDWYNIPIIVMACYLWIEFLKRILGVNSQIKNAYPLISLLTGVGLGILVGLGNVESFDDLSVLEAAITGGISGLSATGGNQIWKRLNRAPIKILMDNGPAKYYITGDKHRHFSSLIRFCEENHLRKKDTVIILGDAGLNYYGDERDDTLKEKLSKLQVTLFCLHGNKENRPQNIPTYGIRNFCGGIVYYEPKYPTIFFAKDGEIYNFNGKKYMTIGGAHSVDRIRCLSEGLPFWEDEMPSFQTKQFVEKRLAECNYRVDGFLTHTCPISCLPTEMFVSTRRIKEEPKKKKKKEVLPYKIDIDRSTEEWLEMIKNNNQYAEWYCGHYHVDKELGDVKMMYQEILPFCAAKEEE